METIELSVNENFPLLQYLKYTTRNFHRLLKFVRFYTVRRLKSFYMYLCSRYILVQFQYK